MMTIGQFSEATGLSISALRFYAGCELLEPAAIDADTGYRRYGRHQIDDGSLVRDLRRLDMPLKDIRVALTLTALERRQVIQAHLRRLDQMVHHARSVAQSLGADTTAKDPPMTTPSHQTGTSNPVATVHARDLRDALRQVLPAAGTDPEQPHFMVVLLEGKAGSIRIVGTDRHRLAVRDLVPTSLDNDFSVIVPAAALRRWELALSAGHAADAAVSMSIDGDTIRLTNDTIELHAAVVPSSFPHYEPVLSSAPGGTSVVVDHDGLQAALEGFDGQAPVRFAASEHTLSIVRDDLTHEVAINGAHDPFSVQINPAFALDAVRSAMGPDLVVEITDPLQPIVFRAVDDGTFCTLVMPVKPT